MDNFSGAQFNVLAGASTITGTGASKFNNSGVFNVASGASLAIGGTATLTHLSGGTYTGSGTLIINAGAAFNLATAASVAPLVQLADYNTAGATISGAGTLTLAGGMDARDGTVSANLTNASGSTIQVRNGGNHAVTFGGTVTNQAGGTILVEGSSAGTAQAVITGTLNNSGTVTLTSTAAYTATLSGAGAVNNLSGGVFNVDAGTGGARAVSVATLSNAGTIAVNTNATYSGATLTNSTGTIAIVSGATFTIAGGSTLAHTGAGAAYTGTGLLLIDAGAAFNLTAAATTAVKVQFAQYNSSGTTIGGSGQTLTVTAGMDARDGTIAANVTNASGSTIQVRNNADHTVTFGGTVTNQAGGTFQVEGSGSGNARAVITGTLNNSGAVTLTSTAGYYATLDATGAVINNLSGGVFNINAGSGGARTIVGTFINSGTMNVNTSTTFDIGGNSLTNSSGSTINITSGTTSLAGAGTLYNSGTIAISSGATLAIASGQTFVQQSGGSYTGAVSFASGSAFQANAAVSFASNVTIGTGGITLSGTGAVTLSATMTVAAASISNNLTVTSGGQVQVFDSSATFNGTVTVQSGGNLRVEDASTSGGPNTTMTLNGVSTNAGTVTLTSSAGSGEYAQFFAPGGFTNTSTGVLNALLGTGGTRYLLGTFSNAGNFNIGAGATLFIINSSTLTHLSGGTYTGTGELAFYQSDFNFATNATVAARLSFTSSSTMKVNDATVTATSNQLNLSFSTLRLEDMASGGVTTLVTSANVQNGGTILLTSSGAGNDTVTLDASGHTINIDANGTLQTSVGTGGGRVIYGNIFNNGGIVSLDASTTLNVSSAAIDNTGTFTIGSGATVNLGGAAYGIHNESGGVLTISAGATLIMNGRDFLNDSGGTINLNGDLYMGDGPGGSASGGGLLTQNGSVSGNGTLHLEGSATPGPQASWTLNPGNSPGNLTIDGSLVFNSLSHLNLELAGTHAGQFDVLNVTGGFALGGTLSAIGYHAFAAQAGDSFDVITYASHSGMFDQVNGLDVFAGVALDPIFSGTGLTLVARTITAEGAEGGDTLTGTSAGDVLVGRGGDDTLSGGDGDDLLLAGEGANTLIGGKGDDRLIGGTGTDTVDYSADPTAITVDLSKGFALDGWGGHDTIISAENVIGSRFADTLIGNAKDNVIIGKGGADTLTGGAGADTFVLSSPNAIAATITDFVSGQDKLQIDLSSFNFTAGPAQTGLNFSVIAGRFDGSLAGANTAFAGGQASLIFSESDSTLYFDANGAQEGYSAVAHLQPGAHLTGSDIRVVDHMMA